MGVPTKPTPQPAIPQQKPSTNTNNANITPSSTQPDNARNNIISDIDWADEKGIDVDWAVRPLPGLPAMNIPERNIPEEPPIKADANGYISHQAERQRRQNNSSSPRRDRFSRTNDRNYSSPRKQFRQNGPRF